jgi:hypothetical protein
MPLEAPTSQTRLPTQVVIGVLSGFSMDEIEDRD